MDLNSGLSLNSTLFPIYYPASTVSNIPKCSQLLCFSIYIFPLQMEGNMYSYTCINTQWFNKQFPSLATLPIISRWITLYGSSPVTLILDENQEHWPSLSINKVMALPQVSHDEAVPSVNLPWRNDTGLKCLWALQLLQLYVPERCYQTVCVDIPQHPMSFFNWMGWWW